MPALSRFFGIVIYMNWHEHPPMHFHAVYGEHEALITLDGKVYAGGLPKRAHCHWCGNGWRSIVMRLKKIGRWLWRENYLNRLNLWRNHENSAYR